MQCELQDKCKWFGNKCEPSVNASMVGCSEFQRKSPSSDGSSSVTGYVEKLLSKWQAEADYYNKTLQVGRDGDDDHTYAHGRLDMIEECIEELAEVFTT